MEVSKLWEIFCGISVSLLILYFLIDKIHSFWKNLSKLGKIIFLSITTTFILICIPPIIKACGSNDINSLFSKEYINFQGYVYAFPKITEAKNYRLKADMIKLDKRYSIKKIYFNNGGYLDIISYDTDNHLSKDGKMYCDFYANGKEWCFRFYGEQIKETK